MTVKFKKTYTFAVKSAFFITLFSTAFLSVLLYYFFEIKSDFIIVFSAVLFLFSFFVLQYRVERFIYRRIKKNI